MKPSAKVPQPRNEEFRQAPARSGVKLDDYGALLQGQVTLAVTQKVFGSAKRMMAIRKSCSCSTQKRQSRPRSKPGPAQEMERKRASR